MDFGGDFDWWDADPGCLESELADADRVDGADVYDGSVPVTDPASGGWVPASVAEIIAEVEAVGPGPDAQRLLTQLDTMVLTADEQLTVVELWEPQQSWLAGQRNTAMVAFAGLTPPPRADSGDYRADDWAVHQLVVAIGASEAFTRNRLHGARALAGTLVGTGAALAAGWLSEYKARLIVKHTEHLDEEVARQVEAYVLPKAASMKAPNLVACIGRQVINADPAAAERRHREGLANLRVVVERSEREPGLLLLEAALPPAQMLALDARLNVKAAEFATADRAARKAHKAAGLAGGEPDPSGIGARPVLRSKDQCRADALAWYVLGPDPADPARPKEPDVHVQVTIDLPTLLHLREHPGTLGRFGPIPAQVARELAADGQWQLFVHEPVTGYLLNRGEKTYRPDTQLDRFVKARDVTDRFPGATTPATSCENDHQIPFGATGGETSAHNLASLAKRHHRAKTFAGWTPKPLGLGVIEWTTPTGRKVTTYPHDYRGDPDDDSPGCDCHNGPTTDG